MFSFQLRTIPGSSPRLSTVHPCVSTTIAAPFAQAIRQGLTARKIFSICQFLVRKIKSIGYFMPMVCTDAQGAMSMP